MSRLGCKGFRGTNASAYFDNQEKKFYNVAAITCFVTYLSCLNSFFKFQIYWRNLRQICKTEEALKRFLVVIEDPLAAWTWSVLELERRRLKHVFVVKKLSDQVLEVIRPHFYSVCPHTNHTQRNTNRGEWCKVILSNRHFINLIFHQLDILLA